VVEDCRINLCDSEYGTEAGPYKSGIEVSVFIISRNVLIT
jgi:hypothetical protein